MIFKVNFVILHPILDTWILVIQFVSIEHVMYYIVPPEISRGLPVLPFVEGNIYTSLLPPPLIIAPRRSIFSFPIEPKTNDNPDQTKVRPWSVDL